MEFEVDTRPDVVDLHQASADALAPEEAIGTQAYCATLRECTHKPFDITTVEGALSWIASEQVHHISVKLTTAFRNTLPVQSTQGHSTLPTIDLSIEDSSLPVFQQAKTPQNLDSVKLKASVKWPNVEPRKPREFYTPDAMSS